MTTLPRLARDEVQALPMRAREIVGYRKSGLSLNHIQGCPLDCAYCIRHTYGLGDQRQPRALMSDDEAVDRLARLLINDGRSVHLTCVPSGGPIGALARELTETLHGIALACLYAADRYHHLTAKVFPHMQAGEVVISDRYVPSALVMQQFDGVDPEFLWRINAKASRPYLAVILYAESTVVADRLSGRAPHNRLQRLPSSANIEWHHYREVSQRLIASGWTILRIDCSTTTVAEVAQMVHQRLREMEGAEPVTLPGHALGVSSRDGHEQ